MLFLWEALGQRDKTQRKALLSLHVLIIVVSRKVSNTILFPFLILSPLWLRQVSFCKLSTIIIIFIHQFSYSRLEFTMYTYLKVKKSFTNCNRIHLFKLIIIIIFYKIFIVFQAGMRQSQSSSRRNSIYGNRRREMIKCILKIEWLPVGMLPLMTVLQGKWNKWKQNESPSLKDPSTSSDCKVLLEPSGRSGECDPQALTSGVLLTALRERQSERLGKA